MCEHGTPQNMECAACRFLAETQSFDRSVTEDLNRIQGERLTLALAAKSQRSIDRGKKPITDSPLFGGDSQNSLF